MFENPPIFLIQMNVNRWGRRADALRFGTDRQAYREARKRYLLAQAQLYALKKAQAAQS